MKIEKRVISNLNKCYAISRLTYQDKPAFLVAAEKHDPCYLFSEDGQLLDTVWTEPGGVMTMTPVPGTQNMFLATHQFYFPTSDAVLMDFDGDGKEELGCISPFHGASLTIYHLDVHGNYVPQWKLGLPEKDTEMIHATWACTLLGRPTWIVGWRKGTRDTVAITWDAQAGTYRTEYIDRSTGCANAMHFVNSQGKDVVVGTNREIDEVAMYIIEED